MRKLSDVIDEYIIQEGYDTRHNFDRYMSLGFRCLKEMNYDISGKPSNQVLTIDNGSACVPCGIVKVIGLFTPERDGLVPIMPSSKLIPAVIENGEIVEPPKTNITEDYLGADFGLTTDVFAARFRRGEFVGHVFSGQEYPYTYYHNHDTNRFEFSSNVHGPVILRGLFNPAMVDGNFIVESFDENAIMLYLRYVDLRSRPNVSLGEKEQARRDYFGARLQARKRHSAPDPRLFGLAFRNNYGLNPT